MCVCALSINCFEIAFYNIIIIVIATDYVSTSTVTLITALPLLSWKHLWVSTKHSKGFGVFSFRTSHLKIDQRFNQVEKGG